MTVTSHSSNPVSGLPVPFKVIGTQVSRVFIGLQDDASAIPSIAPIRASFRDKFFTPETDTAISAIARS